MTRFNIIVTDQASVPGSALPWLAYVKGNTLLSEVGATAADAVASLAERIAARIAALA